MRLMMVAHSDAYWTPFYARFFASRGDQVLVVTFAPDRIDGVDTEFVGVEPFDKDSNKHLFITRVPRVRRSYRQFRPDLVYAPYVASNGLTAVLSCKGPIVVGAVGSDVVNQSGRTGLARWLHERRTAYVSKRADLIHTQSQQIDDELCRLGIPSSKLLRLPVGADLDQFYPHPDMPRKRAMRLICTRKHEKVYDHATVLEALAKLRTAGRDFHCVFTCTGTLLEANKALARRLGVEECVTFTGHLPTGKLPQLLREADVYVSASHSDGTSSALLEAMASGLVPVVSRIPGNLHWISDGQTGLFFTAGKPDELSAALKRAIDDPSLRERAIRVNPGLVRTEGYRQANVQRLARAFDELVIGSKTHGK